LRLHTGPVNAVLFTADGSRLVTAGADGTIQVCDLATERILVGASKLGPVLSAAVSPDGFLLAAAREDGTVRVGPLGTCQLDDVFKLTVRLARAVAFSPDSSRIAVAGGTTEKGGEISVWDVTTGKQITKIEIANGQVASMTFTRDGTQLVSAGGDGHVRIWSLATGETLHTLEGSDSELVSVALSPDGKRIAAAGLGNHAFVWDFASEKLLHVLSGHLAEVWSTVFSPDGSRLATASGDGLVKLWDSETGLEACTLPTDVGGSRYVAFGPNDQIAVGNTDGTVTVFRPVEEDD
jgi:WD40 repeat protein